MNFQEVVSKSFIFPFSFSFEFLGRMNEGERKKERKKGTFFSFNLSFLLYLEKILDESLTYLETMTKEVATVSRVTERQNLEGTADGSRGEEA